MRTYSGKPTKADRIRALKAKGYTYSSIATMTGSCVGYVSAALQRTGGSRPCDLRSAKRQYRKRISKKAA